MDISPTILIIAGFIIIMLGIGAGMLLSSLNEESEPEEGAGELVPPGGHKGRFTAVARMWRERDTGGLVVEMDGKSFLGSSALSEAQREQLERAARDLRAWLGMGMAGAAVDTPLPAAPAAGAVPPVYQTPPAGIAEARPAVQPRSAGAVRGAPAADEAVPLVGPKSIVNQIEDILQDMIASSPLERQGLHLVEDPIRGVIVWVNGQRYEGIDAVPEGEAKTAIRAAVDEWEKTQ